MNLRDLRKQAGLTVKQVAERLGVAEQTLYRYESGERGVMVTTAYQLALIYGVGIDEVAEAIINSPKGE